MQKANVKISYDPEGDVLSWELSSKGKIDYASEIGDVIVHFTEEHTPIYLEILNASRFLRQSTRIARQTEEFVLRDKSK